MNRTFEKFGAETLNRFYMGASHIGDAIACGHNAPITRATAEEAVRDARKALAKDQSKEAVVIVEIVAVIYREELPVEIDWLKGVSKEK
mgnify:CR=1 FL=1